jgi:hypothetical protein
VGQVELRFAGFTGFFSFSGSFSFCFCLTPSGRFYFPDIKRDNVTLLPLALTIG